MWRVAVLHHGTMSSPALVRLRECLRQRGLIAGENCVIDTAGAEGRLERLPRLAEELLRRGPHVVSAIGGVAALAAQRATSTIPVVHAIVLDPTEIDLTAANVTGITTFDADYGLRQLRLLKELVAGLRTIVCLTDPDAPKGAGGINPLLFNLLRAARQEGLRVRCVAQDGSNSDPKTAFDTIRQTRAEALVALEVPAVLVRLGEIAAFAERAGLPTVFPPGQQQTGIVMLGPALYDAVDPLAEYIVAISRGMPVAELPTHRVRHERLEVDVGRARRIGLTVPAAILKRAMRVIEGDLFTDYPCMCSSSPQP